MEKEQVQSFLEAFAIGDAYGKVTEYCSQEEICRSYTHIDKLLTPDESIAHQDLFYGQVTDDTEQNVYLIHEYARQKRITAYDTAMCLLQWVEETDAAQKYIGPNSLRALRSIKEGVDIAKAGVNGTTCGGMMRAPAAVLFSDDHTLIENVVACLLPTHNTSVAIEAAMCYAFALNAAQKGASIAEILEQACIGAEKGKEYGSKKRVAGVAPSCKKRIEFLRSYMPQLPDEKTLKGFLYNILGATLASYDVCACVFALFMFAKDDVHLAIRLATEMGGDTDTIACLAGGLCTMYAGKHNIDRKTVELVQRANKLSFSDLAEKVISTRKSLYGES